MCVCVCVCVGGGGGALINHSAELQQPEAIHLKINFFY